MRMESGSGPGRRRRAPAQRGSARRKSPFRNEGASRRRAPSATRGELERLLRACLRRLPYATTAVAATTDRSWAAARVRRSEGGPSLLVMVTRLPEESRRGDLPPLAYCLGSVRPPKRRPPTPVPPPSSSASLTRRQRDVLQLVAQGWTSKRIARELEISTRTVEAHRANLMARLGVESAAGLVAEAARRGLLRAVSRQEGESHVGL